MPERKFVSSFVDRQGKRRYRFRRTGVATYYFKAAFGTPEFDAEYEHCLRSAPRTTGRPPSLSSARAVARRMAQEHDGAGSFIYFIGAHQGPIKIGVAAVPHRRLKDIQSGSPYPLKMLALAPGTAADEAAIHARLSKHRLLGEWFQRHPDVLAEVERATSLASKTKRIG